MKQRIFLVLIVTLIFSLSCKKSEVNQSISTIEVHTSLVTKGKGHISLFDKHNQIVSDISGIDVSVENSNPLITVPVNSDAEFELPKSNNSGQWY